MLMMSTNPGGGAHCLTMVPSVKVSTLGLEVASGLESQVVIGEPGAESMGLWLWWSCSALRWALHWLQWLWLWWQCHSSPRLWGTSPTGTAALEGLICVQSRVIRAIPFSVSLASATSSASTTSAASTTSTASTISIGGVSRVNACGGSPALSSSPGRHAEGWSAGTACWRVSPKGVAWHGGLGNLTNTRPWLSSTVGHWKKTP